MRLITSRNRQLGSMRGGWNPALRSIFTLADGSRWFVADTGSTSNNSALNYFLFDGQSWIRRGSVMLPAGIGQNCSHITDGRKLYSYAIAGQSLVEVAADPSEIRANMTAYRTFGPTLSHGTNYCGAMFIEPNVRVVWFTTVGPNGGAGTWAYTFCHGNLGWNGPILSQLGGFNSLGYCHMQSMPNFEIFGAAQAYAGQFPNGSKRMAALHIPRLGAPMKMAVITKLPDQKQEPLDIIVDKTRHVHLLWKNDRGEIEYWHAEPKHWPSGTMRVAQIAASQARFCVSKEGVHLGAAFPDGFSIYTADPRWLGGPVDWQAIPKRSIAYPLDYPRGSVPCGVWPGRSRTLLKAPEFAICGPYPDQDHLVHEV